MTNQNRVGAGVPTGGQFAPHQHADDTITLRAQLRDTRALERDLVRQKAVLTAQIIAAEILEDAPTARFLELTWGISGSDYDYYGVAVRDENGDEIVDEDGLAVVEVSDWEDAIGALPEVPSGDWRTDPTTGERVHTPAKGWEWFRHGDAPTIDLVAVRAINATAPLEKNGSR